MDEIFDRFGRLIKSWATQGIGAAQGIGADQGAGKVHRSGDADFDSAMSELDDFLAVGKNEDSEARAAREARERARAEAAAKAAAKAEAATAPDPRLVAAYQTMGLAFGRPFDEVKAKYKKLLMQHHPDRHAGDPASMKRATETSARINSAFQLIETWTSTGKLPN
ncbi:MAG: J domain-containing protein [Rectinemataceae bacterium]